MKAYCSLLFAGGATEPRADHVVIVAAVRIDHLDELLYDGLVLGSHLLDRHHVELADHFDQHVHRLGLLQLGRAEDLDVERRDLDGVSIVAWRYWHRRIGGRSLP